MEDAAEFSSQAGYLAGANSTLDADFRPQLIRCVLATGRFGKTQFVIKCDTSSRGSLRIHRRVGLRLIELWSITRGLYQWETVTIPIVNGRRR